MICYKYETTANCFYLSIEYPSQTKKVGCVHEIKTKT